MRTIAKNYTLYAWQPNEYRPTTTNEISLSAIENLSKTSLDTNQAFIELAEVVEDWAKKILAGKYDKEFESWITLLLNYSEHYKQKPVAYFHLEDFPLAYHYDTFINSFLTVAFKHGLYVYNEWVGEGGGLYRPTDLTESERILQRNYFPTDFHNLDEVSYYYRGGTVGNHQILMYGRQRGTILETKVKGLGKAVKLLMEKRLNDLNLNHKIELDKAFKQMTVELKHSTIQIILHTKIKSKEDGITLSPLFTFQLIPQQASLYFDESIYHHLLTDEILGNKLSEYLKLEYVPFNFVMKHYKTLGSFTENYIEIMTKFDDFYGFFLDSYQNINSVFHKAFWSDGKLKNGKDFEKKDPNFSKRHLTNMVLARLLNVPNWLVIIEEQKALLLEYYDWQQRKMGVTEQQTQQNKDFINYLYDKLTAN